MQQLEKFLDLLKNLTLLNKRKHKQPQGCFFLRRFMYLQDKQKYNEFVYISEEDIHIKHLMLDKMHFSIRQIARIKKNDDVLTINYKPMPKNGKIKKGDILKLVLADEKNEYLPQNKKLKVLYEDEDLLIIDKPPFTVVHPTKSHQEDTLLNYIEYYFEQNNINSKVRFISRLDRDTSGIISVAKNSFSHYALSQGYLSNKIKKYYTAITNSTPKEKDGVIDAPIYKDGDDIKRIIDPKGQEAITYYDVQKASDNFSIIKLLLGTGRTHQIRVHLSHIGCPIIGDELYNANYDPALLSRQALHCSDLEIMSPRSEKIIKLHSDLPNDMQELINKLKK